ncbi:universal stress protein [Novosphingobium sp. BL-52-GroH]|uniref:universal stress protein n=1 Tax=Novosphingobium sp. BL-52-GroH TaxID=3349877 RepID=UPI00384E4D1E
METTMKNVLVLVHDDDGQEARLQAALDLTRALDGHLSCVDVSLYPAFAGDYYYGGGGAAGMLLADERQRESKNKAKLSARLVTEGVSWDWTDVTGNFFEAIVDAARLADVVVVNRELERYPYPDMHGVASRILTHVRVPVLAVSAEQRGLKIGRALVAFDGQASSAATMRACVPILRLAEAVEILMVRDGAEQVEPSEAAAYLSRHGIHAEVKIVDDGLQPADRYIKEESDNFRADYVVMGAYSHGRLMETFGGVTKRMLRNSHVPLLLGH